MPASNTNDTAVNTILKIMNTYGSVSQTAMSEISGYSKGMISIACERLSEAGLITADAGKTKNKEYRLSPDIGTVIGIGIGGTTCWVGLFRITGEELAARKDKIIRDTYRTLLSRGMKGCYVFCMDKALSEYLKRKLDENSKIYYDFASKLGTGMSTAENGHFEA